MYMSGVLLFIVFLFFFFFKQKTAYEMRISDWSSDVCSSDLRPAVEIMTPRPKTIRPDALVEEALAQMNASKITSLFVVADERPVGIVHVHDCLRAGVA